MQTPGQAKSESHAKIPAGRFDPRCQPGNVEQQKIGAPTRQRRSAAARGRPTPQHLDAPPTLSRTARVAGPREICTWRPQRNLHEKTRSLI